MQRSASRANHWFKDRLQLYTIPIHLIDEERTVKLTVELLFTISAVITAIGIILGGIVATYRLARRIGQSIGVDSKGRTLAERLDRVEHQLWENGGSSLADRVNVIETHVVKTTTEIELIKAFVLGVQEKPAEVPKRTRIKKAV